MISPRRIGGFSDLLASFILAIKLEFELSVQDVCSVGQPRVNEFDGAFDDEASGRLRPLNDRKVDKYGLIGELTEPVDFDDCGPPVPE